MKKEEINNFETIDAYNAQIKNIKEDYKQNYEEPAKNIRYVLGANIVMSGVALFNGNAPFTYFFIGTSALSLAKLIAMDDKKILKYKSNSKEIDDIQEKVKMLRKEK